MHSKCSIYISICKYILWLRLSVVFFCQTREQYTIKLINMNYSLFYYKKDWEIFHFLVIKDINMQHELILIDKTVIQIFKHNML